MPQEKVVSVVDLDSVNDLVTITHNVNGVKKIESIPLLDVNIAKNKKLAHQFDEINAKILVINDKISMLESKNIELSKIIIAQQEIIKSQNETIKAINDRLSIEGRI